MARRVVLVPVSRWWSLVVQSWGIGGAVVWGCRVVVACPVPTACCMSHAMARTQVTATAAAAGEPRPKLRGSMACNVRGISSVMTQVSTTFSKNLRKRYRPELALCGQGCSVWRLRCVHLVRCAWWVGLLVRAVCCWYPGCGCLVVLWRVCGGLPCMRGLALRTGLPVPEGRRPLAPLVCRSPPACGC